MSCALQQAIGQCLGSPENQKILKELLTRYREDPQYFVFLKSSLEMSLPRELGFEERIVRMTCDKCALNPLEECRFMDILVAALQERSMDGR